MSSLVCQFLHDPSLQALILNYRRQIQSHCHHPYPTSSISVALHTILLLAVDVTDNFLRLQTTLDETSFTIALTTAGLYLCYMDKLGSDCSPLQHNNTPLHPRRQSTLYILHFQNPATLPNAQISRRAAVHHLRKTRHLHARHPSTPASSFSPSERKPHLWRQISDQRSNRGQDYTGLGLTSGLPSFFRDRLAGCDNTLTGFCAARRA